MKQFLKRRSFLQKASAVLGAMGISTLFTSNAKAEKPIDGKFVHVVFFWLKDPQNKEAKKTFESGLRSFIEGVDVIKSHHIGTPANTSRPVIDSSYSFCLIVTFDSKKEHDIYQEHSLHKKFIEDLSPLWEKVVVYDSIS
ncbi:Dabb family protein [Fulvivirgaceae bacterium BMA10]|uniref:Dabb family protein n=1 Tax=Splendidivirga corallicola TaxID=3051826 RepID=A0ABT8KUB7_9BACT|nr:Dabb family protein [Fulvivirgaceae bacterium BMA10]